MSTHRLTVDGSARRAAAFSLIEIMVAVSILAFMIVGLLAMFYHVQRAFRAGVTQLDIMEGGRAIMGLMTRELQTEAAGTRVASTAAINFLIRPAWGLTHPGGELDNSQALPSGQLRTNFLQDVAFLVEDNGEWTANVYAISNAASGLGTLYRRSMKLAYESNPEVERDNLLRHIDRAFYSRVLASLTNPASSDPFSKILDGVAHFRITTYQTNGLIDWRDETREGTTFTNRYMPAYVDVELAIVEPSAIEKFRANEQAGGSTAAHNYLKRQIGKTHLFRQRVAIRPSATNRSTE